MRRPLAAAFLAGVLAAGEGRAVTVFRCNENGSVAYRQNASGPHCEPLDIKTAEPDPGTLAEQRESLERSRERRAKAREARRRPPTPREPARTTARRNDEFDPATPPPALPRELDFSEPTR